MFSIAALGFGARGSGMVRRLLELAGDVRLGAIADPDHAKAKANLEKHKIKQDGIRFFESVDQLLDSGCGCDGFLIGTRCHLHTPIAVKLAPLGKPVFLEKPVSITWEQLCELAAAYRGREDSVVVSFPLRLTPLLSTVRRIIRDGRLGVINQIQARNNINYGGAYFGRWYRNYEQVGGLWLQKATHDFDYINALVDARPQTIAAMSNRMGLGGDKPFDLKCSSCAKTETCIQSPKNLAARDDHGGYGWGDHDCPFSRGIENQDSGSALVQYANGVHASYSQNFLGRRTAELRGATVIGYDATLDFDWYTNLIRVWDHHHDRIDDIHVKTPGGGHGGGDDILLKTFAGLMRGEKSSLASLHAGLLSAAMCLAARQSCRTQSMQFIRLPGEEACVPQRPACTLVEP
ncbi:MAG: Gfo/Idh/MocA family protein [Phycisphaerales bacterium]